MSDVSTISSARSRIAFSRDRSSRIPSLTERSCASGCGRRVSLKRRTSAAVFASRKIRIGLRRRHLPQLAEDLRKRRDEAALPHVDDDRDLLDLAAGAQRQLGERGDERGRQVVDAEVAEILERADRLRLARARQSGEDDERCAGGSAFAARAFLAHVHPARVLPGLALLAGAHRDPPDSSSSSSSSGVVTPASRAAPGRGDRPGRGRRDGRAPAAAGCARQPRRGSRRCGRARPASG